MTAATRLKYLAESPHDMVEPTSRGPRVTHYSIPNIDSVGIGLPEDSESIESSKLIVEEDDILVSKLNPHKPRIVKVQKSSLPIVASSEFVVLRDPCADRGYLRYFLNSRYATDDLISRMRSVTRSHQRAQPDDILNLELPDMPLSTQRKIAGFLDRETARIDALIDKKRRLIDLLEEKRTATITQAVTKGLDPTAPMKPSNIPWIGNVPAHWEIATLRRILESISDGPFGSSLTSAHYSPEGARVVRLGNIGDGVFEENDQAFIPLDYYNDALNGFALQPGDIVMAGLGDERRGLGRTVSIPPSILPAIVKADCFRLRTISSLVDRGFVVEYFSSSAGAAGANAQSRGTTRLRINTTIARDLALPVPPLSEQAAIVTYARAVRAAVGETTHRLETQLTLLADYREALITAAVTGEIDVDTFSANQHREEATA